MKMLTMLHMALKTLMALTVLCLLLPSTSSVRVLSNLRSPQPIGDESEKEGLYVPVFSKREISGADPWSLCPNSMERVECFFEYLRVYARLRKATSGSNSVSVRNIGKRASYKPIAKITSCPEGFSTNICFLLNPDFSTNEFDKDSTEGQMESDTESR